jgi:plastocyanin
MLRILPFAAAFALLATPLLAADHKVEIKGMKFVPASLTIAAGDTVTFTNQDAAPHTATANNGAFDTGRLNRGQSKQVTVKAGTHAYKCALHPMMTGTVVAK